jgi:hypothetical protein
MGEKRSAVIWTIFLPQMRSRNTRTVVIFWHFFFQQLVHSGDNVRKYDRWKLRLLGNKDWTLQKLKRNGIKTVLAAVKYD